MVESEAPATLRAADIEGAIAAEQAFMLYRSPVTMLINLVTAPAAVVLAGRFYSAPVLAGWLLAFYLLTGWRFWGWRAYRRAPQPAASAPHWLARYRLGALLAGCLWAMAASLVFLVDDNAYDISVGFAAILIVAAGTAAYSVHLPTFSAFALPPVFAAVAALLWRNTPSSITMALTAVVFLVILSVIGRELNRALLQTYSLKAEKAALVRELAAGRDAAQQESSAKSEFLAHLSHELRTPLNAIIGFSEMFTSERFGPMPSDYVDYGRHINEAAQHLFALVTRTLDMLKAEAGGLSIEEDAVDLEGVIQSALRMVEEQAAKAGVALERDIAAGLPLLRGDGGRLRQVVINLLTNAIKASRRGGAVRVEARWEENGGDGDGALRLAVADNGIGMKPEDIPRALIPFVQLEGRQGPRSEGAGLGLPLAKRLVELHGGRFEIESALGQGTTVTLCLPRERVLSEPARSNVS
jgi:signal transduction histidine kinase